MRFRVSQELRQPVGTEFVLELRQAYTMLDDDAALTDLEGSATLLRTDRGLLVTVRGTARMTSPCCRCLAPALSPVDLEFQDEFIPVIDPVSGKHITPAEAEQAFVIGPDLTLDLGEPLRQYALMASPTKPLCRDDCAGLCATCGTNLNESRCSCLPEDDGRWQALAAFKTKDQEGS